MSLDKFHFQNDVKYELTISPNDKVNNLFESLTRVHSFYSSMTPILNMLKPVSNYTLNLEISDQQHHNKSGNQSRLHFHGVITFSDVATYMVEIANKMALSVDIQYNPYRETWPDYCTKQKSIMEPYCKSKFVHWQITNNTDTSKLLSKHALRA